MGLMRFRAANNFDTGGLNDFIRGGTGSDRISGLHGDDTPLGEAGRDDIRDSLGDDTLRGGDGNDSLLDQGPDNSQDVDKLYGEAGDDDLRANEFNGDALDTLDGGPHVNGDVCISNEGDTEVNCEFDSPQR